MADYRKYSGEEITWAVSFEKHLAPNPKQLRARHDGYRLNYLSQDTGAPALTKR